MKISQKGIDLIKKWEQFRANAYHCSAGILTIGYGHTRTAGNFTQAITEAQAEELLKQDISIFEEELKSLLKDVNLRQCQYDAIVVFAFNAGTGNFKKSTFFKLMKINPDNEKIADSWITWRRGGGRYLRGLMRRRIQELDLYFSW